jgi:hypothetical protein
VLLSSIYVAAAAGNRHLCEKVEQRRKERGMKRQLDYTRIEVNYQMWYTGKVAIELAGGLISCLSFLPQ